MQMVNVLGAAQMTILDYRERAMMDAYTIANFGGYRNNQLQIAVEVVLLIRDTADAKLEGNELARRMQLATYLALSPRQVSIQQLELIAMQLTGNVPSPINLAESNEGL